MNGTKADEDYCMMIYTWQHLLEVFGPNVLTCIVDVFQIVRPEPG
jgi:hypothetical protein